MIGPEKLTILLAEVCCIDCIIEVGVFPLGEVEDPPDEREEEVELTWVPLGTLLGVDRSVDVMFVALDRISSMGFPLESYLCP
ncbi:MAG: hypothetical protein K940chlam9_01939 [Chlamydiae bacterium]|nr:hypothetical protein [Chlamydiota bacterium]